MYILFVIYKVSKVKNVYSIFQKEPLSIWSDSRDVMFISKNNIRPDIVFIELEKPYNLHPERTYPACLPSRQEKFSLIQWNILYCYFLKSLIASFYLSVARNHFLNHISWKIEIGRLFLLQVGKFNLVLHVMLPDGEVQSKLIFNCRQTWKFK